MWVQTAAILALGLIAAHPPEAPQVDPEVFRAWFDEAVDGRLRVPEPVRVQGAGYRYVFVGGLRSEQSKGYFAQNTAELIRLGVPAGAIHQIRPSPDATFSENLGMLRAGFHAAAEAGPERLVVIAHSRGACDTLAFALREPEFVRDHVQALFLVQGPFGGSGLADYVLGEGAPMDRRMPLPARAVAGAVAGFERTLLRRRGRHAGLADLTRDASRDFWRQQLEEHAEARPIVGPRTFFIEADIPPSKHSLFRKPAARYLETYYGPNDGVVARLDQSLPGLGTNLGGLGVGHTDLTHRFPAAKAQGRLRRAFVQTIIMAVGHDAMEAEPKGHRLRSRRTPERGRGG